MEIIGNDLLKKQIFHSLETGSLNHTLLFSGAEGIGKGIFAKEIAKKLLASNPEKIDLDTHPDCRVFYPEATSGLHSIEKMRFLIDEVYKPPFEASHKVFIIHDAHLMLASSANALLKTLEEPTEDSTIILLSSRKEALLPTIISRCKVYLFASIMQKDIESYLIEKNLADKTTAPLIAKRAEGSLGDALIFAQDAAYQKKREPLFKALVNPATFLQKIEEIQGLLDEEKKEGINLAKQENLLLKELYLWQRDLCSAKYTNSLFYPEYKEILKERSEACDFQKLKNVLTNIQEAKDRNMRFSSCLAEFFLQLQNV